MPRTSFIDRADARGRGANGKRSAINGYSTDAPEVLRVRLGPDKIFQKFPYFRGN
jgi:hypothetical protein